MKKLLATSVAIAAMTTGFATTAQAEIEGLSANAGFMSDYVFRGANLGDASAYTGVDYEAAGFYVGTWAADLGGQFEYDLYAGWGMETESGLSFSVGVTDYEYTGLSNSQMEVNLGLGYAGFGVDIALGEDSTIGEVDGADADYTFASVYWSGDVFGVLMGSFDHDTFGDYLYFEASAGGEIAGLDTALTIGATSVDGGGNNEYITLDISKSFSF